MAFTTGTSTDYADLLADIRTWLIANGWTSLAYSAVTQECKSVDSIAAAGSGYAVDDTITLTGGTFTTATVLTVTSVSGGAVTGVSITTPGDYSVIPTDPVAQGSTSGSGTGATFNLTYNDSTGSLSLQAPGNGTGKEVFINIETVYDDGNNHYGWKIFGATGWLTGLAHGSQQGAGGPVWFNLADSSIDYWIYANDRRFILIAQVGTNYMSMYAGFFLPFALGSEYPFPLAIIASYPELALPSVANARNAFIADPGDGAAYYRRRTAESWRAIQNQSNSSSANAPVTGQRAFIWPYKTGRTPGSGSVNPNNWNFGGIEKLVENFENETPLFQCHIIDMVDDTIIGALEGVFATSGFNRAVEQVVTISSQDYRLFQRVFRSNPGDFMAIEET